MDVLPGEKLARFIFSKSQFSAMKREVKFWAFIPPSNSKDISVYRTSSLTESEVWAIGLEYVQGKRTLRARAGLSAEQVYNYNLKVIPDTQPHELHANITPFPADKSERQSIARKLALASKLVIMPIA